MSTSVKQLLLAKSTCHSWHTTFYLAVHDARSFGITKKKKTFINRVISIWKLCQHWTHVCQLKWENVLYWLEKGSRLKIIDSEPFIDIIPPPEETHTRLRKQRLDRRSWSLSPDSSTAPIDMSQKILSACESKDYRSSSHFRCKRIIIPISWQRNRAYEIQRARTFS